MQTVLQVLNVVIPLYAKLRPGGMTDAEEDDAKLMDDATANVGMLGMPSGGQ